MSPTRRVGLDVGGTSIKGGAVTEAGEILARGSRPFSPEVDASEILDRAADLARELGVKTHPGVETLGVGCAGLFERSTGTTVASANMPNLVGVSLTQGLAERLDLPVSKVRLENDGNVAALGEQWQGGGEGARDLLFVTLGTGVGGGIVLGGELLIGAGGMGGEFGHLVVRPAGAERPGDPDLRCRCGATGCIERLASATAAKERARAVGLGEDLEQIALAARHAPGPERHLMHAIGRDLGQAMGQAVMLLDIPLFVVGGGFGAALEALRPGIEEVLAERAYGRPPARVVGAKLGSDAGWIGATRLR